MRAGTDLKVKRHAGLYGLDSEWCMTAFSTRPVAVPLCDQGAYNQRCLYSLGALDSTAATEAKPDTWHWYGVKPVLGP